jgi:hypothetical protein
MPFLPISVEKPGFESSPNRQQPHAALNDCSFCPVLAQIIAAGLGLSKIKFDDDLVPDDSTHADGFSFTQTKNSSGETWTRFF